MKKNILIALILLFVTLIFNKAYAGPLPAIFEVTVTSNVTDSYDYQYILNYATYDPEQYNMRGLSHWWLEVNCAHVSIDASSIYGYTIFNDTRYDWTMVFDDNVGQVGGYTDWVIKWDAPTSFEIPKTSGGLIGYFGFHSTQPPEIDNWGAKDGQYNGVMLYDYGTTQIPRSLHGQNVPEPATMSLLGMGLFGLLGLKRVRKIQKG